MKSFLKEALDTDDIEKFANDKEMERLKKAVEGESLIGRIKYRRQVGNMMSGKRQVVKKGEIMRMEHETADHIAQHDKHEHFGFNCLHYSVSESSGTIKIEVLNK
jgi:hypothetical protein